MKPSDTFLYFLFLFFLLGGLAFTYYIANAQEVSVTEEISAPVEVKAVFSRLSKDKEKEVEIYLFRSQFDKRYIKEYVIENNCIHIVDDDSIYCGNYYLKPVISSLWEDSL